MKNQIIKQLFFLYFIFLVCFVRQNTFAQNGTFQIEDSILLEKAIEKIPKNFTYLQGKVWHLGCRSHSFERVLLGGNEYCFVILNKDGNSNYGSVIISDMNEAEDIGQGGGYFLSSLCSSVNNKKFYPILRFKSPQTSNYLITFAHKHGDPFNDDIKNTETSSHCNFAFIIGVKIK